MAQRHSIITELSRRSFRNLFGYMLFAVSTIIPSITEWRSAAPVQSPPAMQPMLMDRLPRHRFGHRFDQPRLSPGGIVATASGWAWWLARIFFAAAGTTIAMIILLPYPGCKRFALLFGAPTGLAAMTASAFWLSGRAVVYRSEPVLIAILAALPVGLLWIVCCKNAFERRFNARADCTRNADRRWLQAR